ncbi:hypothetical protein [Paenibacillus xylanivorans]|uniref:Uncharacterized protein n=1 Tax=Paenibacillus xylanivorans TaxID=1705561 RepID=A0A0M9BKH0_9BACL|nr:hypothetical protein [Paenibacillus xylanivorans]KOY13809.1 hypothetical protein AMS66_25770 [Paenibacillus xylanivorans]
MILSTLVNQYEKNMASYEEWKLSDFRSKYKKIEEHIKDAVWGYLPNRKRDSHQAQLDKGVLEEVTQQLLDQAIIDQLNQCNSFDEILIVIYRIKIKGFGALSVYDTALRLGAYYHLYPDVVYLHRGAEDGAKRLLNLTPSDKRIKYFCNDSNYPYLPKESFPIELQNLTAHHIENFLCRMKEDLILRS